MNYMDVEGFPGATSRSPRKKKKKQVRPTANVMLPGELPLPARTVSPLPLAPGQLQPFGVDPPGAGTSVTPTTTGVPDGSDDLAFEDAHPRVDYAQAAQNELAILLQPTHPFGVDPPVRVAEPEGAVAPGTAIVAADQPVGVDPVTPGSPVSVTPTTTGVPDGSDDLAFEDAPPLVDPNAEAARQREAEAELQREAEAARQREAEAELRRKHDEYESYRQRNRREDERQIIQRKNREQAELEAAELQRKEAAQTEHQRLEDMAQQRLREELTDAQRLLAEAMTSGVDPTAVSSLGGLNAADLVSGVDPTAVSSLGDLNAAGLVSGVDPPGGAVPSGTSEIVSPEIAAAGGYTDRELREQQMQEQHSILTSAEALAAERAGGLERQRPELLATGDVRYDPEYFGYEGDLQKVILDALRQNLTGAGGMDMRTASQIADLEERQRKDETQTMEDLQRLGVLHGGGDTADVLGELRAGYGRTYADIMGAAQGRSDPQLEAAMNLARMASDRYMTGGEMIGRLGGQDTLEARLAQQEALERGEDLQRGDVMLEQDIADRALARGLTLTEPTTRERFEEGVRGAQEAESLARAGMTGYLGDQSTIKRERMLDLERERDEAVALEQAEMRELERELAAGQVSLEGEEDRIVTIAGQEAGAEERMQTERVDADKAMLNRELSNRVMMGLTDAKKARDIQTLINEGRVNEAAALLDVREAELESAGEMQAADIAADKVALVRKLGNLLSLGRIDAKKARDIQTLINSGDLALAGKELEVRTAELTSAQEMQAADIAADKVALTRELGNRITMGKIDAKKATDIRTLINSGDLALAEKELEAQTGRLDMAREMAAGEVTIDDVRTKTLDAGRLELEEDLTNAQLQQLYRTEQGQSIANMIALVNTLPEGSTQKEDLEAKIATAIGESVEDGALKNLLFNMLDVSKTDFVRQEDGAVDGADQVSRVPAGDREYKTEEDWLADNPIPKGYNEREGKIGKEPDKWSRDFHGTPTDTIDKKWIAWDRRNQEFLAWDRRRQDFLDNVLEEPGQDVDTSTTDETAAGDTGQTGILDLDPENNETSDQEAQDDAAVNDGTAEEAEQGTGTPKQNRQALKIKITTDLNADIKQSWRRPGSDTFVVLLSDGTYVIGNSTTGDYSQAESKADAKEQTGMGLKR